MTIKSGVVFPGGDAPTAVEFAQEVEAAGWDGFFVWEPVWGVDPWVTLGAIAMCTERVRIGTMLTPVSRRRPWKLAGETATLDHLSNGRVILSVGLGALDTGFENFGEETDRKIRDENVYRGESHPDDAFRYCDRGGDAGRRPGEDRRRRPSVGRGGRDVVDRSDVVRA